MKLHPLEARRLFAAGAVIDADGVLFVQGTLKDDRVALFAWDDGATIRARQRQQGLLHHSV